MNHFFEHFHFAQIGWLWLLPPLLLLPLLRRGRGASAALQFPQLSILASLGHQVRQRSWNYGPPLGLLALALAIVSLARPIWRETDTHRTASGVDIVIAFDFSLSMDIDDFRQDGRPLRRIDAAKAVVNDFITGRPDDRMGLVVFSGRPYVASPITLDHEQVRQRLREINLGDLEEQGTAIGSALASSANRLIDRNAKSKIIVLITDGASNSGKLAPVEAAEYAKTLGIKIYTVAIGTLEGRVSRNIQRFPRQEFDLPTLRKIASLTGGEHYWAQDLDALKDTFSTINQLEKTEISTKVTYHDTEWFPWVAGASLLCAMAAAWRIALDPPIRQYA